MHQVWDAACVPSEGGLVFYSILVVDAAEKITVRMSDLFLPVDIAPQAVDAQPGIAR